MKYLIYISTLMLASLPTFAKEQPSMADLDRVITDVQMKRDGSRMVVTMDVLGRQLGVGLNRAVVVTPVMVNGQDTLQLPSVGVYGTRRWWYYQRQGRGMLTGADERSYRASSAPDTIAYRAELPVEPWMSGSHIDIFCREYGCCSKVLAQSAVPTLAQFNGNATDALVEYVPVERLVVQNDTVYEISGSAYVIFPVNSVALQPKLHNNAAELARITSVIDSLRHDPLCTIQSISIRGYASPEGALAANQRLAKGRTEALAAYIADKCDLGQLSVETSYEAEDWEGLRRFVTTAKLTHGREILDVIDSDMPLDEKEQRIRTKYPEEYDILLKQYYPALRHTDYFIKFQRTKPKTNK